MQVDSCQEADESDDMLQNEKFVAPLPDRRKGTQHNPQQDDPCGKTSLGDFVRLQFGRDVVIARPVPEPKSHVNRHRQKQNPCRPPMEPVQAFMAGSDQKADDVLLASKKNDQGELRRSNVSTSIRDIFPLPLVKGIIAVKAQHKDCGQLGQDHCQATNGRRRRLPSGRYRN